MKINIHTHSVSSSDKRTDTIEIVNHIINSSSIEYQGKYVSLGIHPWYIHNPDEQLEVLEKALASDVNIIAIGEAGLDKLKGNVMKVQHDVFEKQALLAEQYSKPFIIHCVKAFDELLAFKKRIRPSVPWIIHGFRGNHIQAQQLVRNGMLLSFGPQFNCQALNTVSNGIFFLETDDYNTTIDDVYHSAALAMDISVEDLEFRIEDNFRSMNSFN
ncbi:MAG: TatD family hydrolase [Parabacteroides sp.]|nr:TatD family hydrolase [Parabacteroides sp.]